MNRSDLKPGDRILVNRQPATVEQVFAGGTLTYRRGGMIYVLNLFDIVELDNGQ
jgi:hypothetical protein